MCSVAFEQCNVLGVGGLRMALPVFVYRIVIPLKVCVYVFKTFRESFHKHWLF